MLVDFSDFINNIIDKNEKTNQYREYLKDINRALKVVIN
jgi:hypothetical protein